MDDQRSILSPTDTAGTLAGSGFRNAQNHLVGAFTTKDFRSAVQLLDAVAVVADELNHHPDVRLGWGRVEFALTSHVDHKTELQEQLARTGRTVSYTTLKVEGPPHERSFTAAAVVGGEVLGTGVGRSKKDAEQEAARATLDDLSE